MGSLEQSQNKMNEVMGIFPLERLSFKQISLTLPNCAGSLPWALAYFWVDFIVAYYQVLFAEESWKQRLIEPEQCADGIRFVVNELLENAVKYNQSGDITLVIGLEGKYLVCLISNQVLSTSIPRLRERFATLLTESPSELLNDQVEENLRQKEKARSGLGFLLLRRDYLVSLSWKLEPVSPNLTCLQTMGRMPIFKE